MFGKKSSLNRRLEYMGDKIEILEDKIKILDERYWSLWHKHELLLKHFDLFEHKVPEYTELRTKGGPERGA